MKRLELTAGLLVVLFASSLCAQESKFYNVGKAAFHDEHYDVAEKQFRQLMEKHPDSSKREEVALLLAQSQLNLGRWEDSIALLQKEIGAGKLTPRFADGYVFWLAEAHSKGKQFAEAEQHYREVITKYPKSQFLAQAKYGLAWALYQTNRSSEALTLFEELASSKDKAVQEIAQNAQIGMGQVHLARKEFDKAAEVFRPIAEKTPPGKSAYEARYWLGQGAYEQKQYTEALSHFDKIISQTKVWPAWVLGEAWSTVGWIRWQNADYENSAKAFEQALQTLDSEKKKRESAIQYGQCYLRLGKIDTAIDKLREFVKAHAQDSLAGDVQLAIGDIYLSQNKFEDAIREYGQLINNFPAHDALPRGYYYRGWAFFEQKKFTESIEDFQRASATTRDPGLAAEAMYKTGDAYWKLEQWQKAATAYEGLINKYPNTAHVEEALFQIIQVQLNLQNSSQAKAALAKLVEKFPESRFRDESYLQIGLEYVKEGYYTAAREHYKTFLNKYPESPLAPKAILDIGQSYYLEGAYSEALEQFDKIASEDPPVHSDLIPVAKYRRGLCLYQIGEPKQAVKEFAELVEKYKDAIVTPEVQFRIGEFFYNQKDYQEAQRQFGLLQKNYPQSPYADAALYYAGRSAFARQGYKEATEYFQKLLATYPNSVWRPDARFWQGDALIEQGGDGGYQKALLVFDELIREFKDSDLVDEAWGRKGDCQFTLKRYEEAITSYRNVVDSARADISQKNHAHYQIGVCYEKLGRLSDAFDEFMGILYYRVTSTDPKPVTESYWFCKAGMDAARIKKQQEQWREAMKVYEQIVQANVSCSQEAQEQLRTIAETKLIPVLGQ